MPNTKSWNTHIGLWKKRTLLAKECELLASSRPRPRASANPPAANPWKADGGSQHHLNIEPLRNGQAATAIAWLAGCPFLLGAPRGITGLLEGAGCLPRQIMLLTWDPSHVEGLREYCALLVARPVSKSLKAQHAAGRDCAKAENPVIWTSAWIENEIRSAQGWTDPDGIRWATFEESLPHTFRNQTGRGFEVLAFAHGCPLNAFAPQVGWQIYYEVTNAALPRLHVEFRLFGHRLIVRLDRSAWGNALLPTLGEYERRVIKPLLLRHPQARHDLLSTLGQRLSELTMIAGDTGSAEKALVFTLQDAALHHIDGRAPTRTETSVYPHRIILPHRSGPRRESQVRRFIPTVPAAILPEDSPIVDADWGATPKIHLAIGCGLFSDPSGGELKASQRFLLAPKVGPPVEQGSAHTQPQRAISISLLGLKIVDYLRDQHDPSSRVFEPELLLIVSPWTEASVRREVARLQQEFPRLWNRGRRKIQVRYLAQNITFVEPGTRDGLQPYDYYPAGHFDVLDLFGELAHSRTFGQKPDRNAFIYFTNYNNIGRNINGKVCELAAAARQQRSQDRCLLFELTQQPSADPSGSCYVKDLATGAICLIKPEYVLPLVQHGRGRDAILCRGGSRQTWISTGSVLVHLQSLLANLPAIRRTPFIERKRALAPGLPERTRLERDLDLTTMLPQLARHWTAVGVEGTRRFFALKRESDLTITTHDRINELYDSQFVDFAAKWTRFAQADLQGPLVLTPSFSHAPWASQRLGTKKNSPAEDPPPSEAKELYIDAFGVSGFCQNALESLPILGTLTPSDPAISVKLLDSNDWLSIQLHPDGRTAEHLARLLRREASGLDLHRTIKTYIEQSSVAGEPKERNQALNELYHELRRIKDTEGKAEVFYVIRNDWPGIGAPHFLGIENGRLQRDLSSIDIDDPVSEQAILRTSTAELEGFLKWDEFADLKRTTRRKLGATYRNRFESLIRYHLPVVLKLRKDCRLFTNSQVLRGIVLILAMQALAESIKKTGAGDPADGIDLEDRDQLIRSLYHELDSPLLAYFHRPLELKPGSILHVKPGVVHAAGPGLLTVELSHRSDNTFRIHDHGREFATPGRETHYTLAAVALSQDSFFDEQNEPSAIYPPEEIQKLGPLSPPLRFDNIELEVLPPSRLKGDGVPLGAANEFADRGVVVLCAAGKVRLTRDDGPHKRVLTELPELHTALFPVRPRDPESIRIETDGYSDAICLRTWIRLSPSQPAVVVVVGGTHFQFIYDSGKPGDRATKRHLWHQVLPELISNSPARDGQWWQWWDSRIKALSERLAAFLDNVHKTAAAVRLLGISWPGLVDPTTATMHSSVLGCQKLTAHELAAMVQVHAGRLQLDASRTKVLFDARADALAEMSGLMGGLPRAGTHESAMLWNIGSGICSVLVKDGQIVEGIDLYEDGAVLMTAHIGRLLWFNSRTREWLLDKTWKLEGALELIRNGKFDVPCPVPGAESEWIRLSDCLSTTAIVLRFLRLAQNGWHDNHLNTVPGLTFRQRASIWSMIRRTLILGENGSRTSLDFGDLLDRCVSAKSSWSETLTSLRPGLNALAAPLFEWMRQHLAEDSDSPKRPATVLVHSFVEDVAHDFAAMLTAFLDNAARIDGSGILRPASQRLVLGGFGGTAFGRGRATDPFLQALKCALTQRLGPIAPVVVRSRMFQSDFRLIDLFRRAARE